MARVTNPMPTLPPPPAVSRRTVPVSGLLVDFYGIDELTPETQTVSVLWLHHARMRNRGDMGDIAARCIHAVAAAAQTTHRLVAAAFDQRNHGSRLAAAQANGAWAEGNPTHAQDMFGTVAGTVADQRLLLDLVEAYPGVALPAGVRTTQHFILGVSLGGHTGWQLLLADDRVTAGVLVVGCPDYMELLRDRAALSKLPTAGTSFFGSRDFPEGLVAACLKHDAKGIVFGTATPAWPPSDEAAVAAIKPTLQQRVTGKRFLVCSGAEDKAVPYRCAAPFLTALKRAAATWPDLDLVVHDKVYEGIGHAFSEAMVADAVQFVVDTVQAGPNTSSKM
ncbi:hypothetical protein SPI_06338 [Niveomyces insectorum RCEF 264]|uniref:AB hydrolase-1 domain-containing protein n=1 Tax=Niveomyces insectorum RCEF 264 TaxID=1081102 RepID=A0A167S1C2_9HYPO|nr:hypothetical protein SPI_06338 [Niveomyces insectorum RCEF 264]